MNALSTGARRAGAAIRAVLVLTVLCGLLYPLLVTGLAQAVLPHQANGSMVRLNGREVGSALIGQEFDGPRWFHSRPSAASDPSVKNAPGYNPLFSGATNLGPNDSRLVGSIQEAKAAVAKENGVPLSAVPPDAVTASGSGLDPDISPAYARIQAARVAAARRLPLAAVLHLVDAHTSGRALGVLGEPHVNVLNLNLALNRLPA